MSTDIKSSSTATHVGLVAREKAEVKSQPKGLQDGIYEDVEARVGNGQLDESAEDSNGLPPNGTFSLWQMLMAIMKYEKNNLDNSAEMQKNYAENLGGSNGIFAKLYSVGCEVGKKDAETMRDDAYGKFAQAGVAGGSLVGSAAMYGVKTRPAINQGEATIKNATDMESAINNSGAAIQIKAAPAVKPPVAPVSANVQARVDGWADGSHPIDNFDGMNKDGTANMAEAHLNRTAAEHVANDSTKRAKIQKRIDKQKESGQGAISNADQKFNTFQNINSTVTQGLQNVAGGGAAVAGAEAAKAKAKANAEQSVISQVQQGVTASETKAEQNAQEALQQANQWAAGFASAASAQVHG
jgi:hypothetical protein